MPHEIVLVHREKSAAKSKCSPLLSGAPYVLWETCLRQVYFCDSSALKEAMPDDVQVFRDRDAYEFCLEITCGLNSPIIGETEVWGQFKALFRDFDYQNSQLEKSFTQSLRKFVEGIFSDAKLIRHRHLRGLGSQSYGSLARRLVKDASIVHFVGAGCLTKDMLPWLVKQCESVKIHCRREEQGLELKEAQVDKEKIVVSSLSSTEDSSLRPELSGAVVIAAPMSAQELEKTINVSNSLMIIDLRDNSKDDPIESNGQVIPLTDFFAEIENTKAQLHDRVQAARAEISLLSKKKYRKVIVRPQGWDDLWL